APEELRGRGPGEVWLDERFAAARLYVRARRDGDRVRPVGLGGTKKLQDIFVDAKVPASERRRWPVVCAGRDILWVPGIVLAEGAGAPAGEPAVHMRRLGSSAPPAGRERTYHGLQKEHR
ncbi:MAG: tRNA lysidine(34) synthetase TilS, partial [bacterium]